MPKREKPSKKTGLSNRKSSISRFNDQISEARRKQRKGKPLTSKEESLLQLASRRPKQISEARKKRPPGSYPRYGSRIVSLGEECGNARESGVSLPTVLKK